MEPEAELTATAEPPQAFKRQTIHAAINNKQSLFRNKNVFTLMNLNSHLCPCEERAVQELTRHQ